MPNTTTEMEVDTIQVPHSAESLEELFLSMNTPQVLMQGLDPETWEAHRQELLSAVHDIPWPVRRGSFRLDNYPIVSVGARGSVRIRTTPLSVAQQFLASASNNRLSLVLANPDQAGKYRIKAISNLEDAAWASYGGAGLYLFADASGTVGAPGEEVVDLRNLANIMAEFTTFMHSRDHRAYIRAAIRERMNSGNKKVPADKGWDGKRVEQFQEFLKTVKSRLKPEENPFSKLPILPHKTLSSRTWGIEIEAVDIAGVKTPEYWQLKNDGSLRNLGVTSIPSRTKPAPEVGTPNVSTTPTPPTEPSSDDHADGCLYWSDADDDDFEDSDEPRCDCGYRDEWNEYNEQYRAFITTYGSAYVNQNIRSDTGEWNSPVLRSYHSRGLKYLTNELEPRRTNDSAGVHVHVGAADLSPEQAIQVSMIYTALEPLFESAYMRGNTRNYCKSPDVAELITRFNAMRKAKKNGFKATEMQFSSRYWTVNLAALYSHKTIEFRAMGSVYNYDHLVRWAYFCRELVNIAKANVPQSAWTRVRTMEDLVSMFAKYGKETPTPEWAATELATDIVESLGTENRRLPQWSRLIPDNNRSPLLVNDDYTAAQTYFLGERPVEREDEYQFSF
jgi:Putative amidoligase enzyme.